MTLRESLVDILINQCRSVEGVLTEDNKFCRGNFVTCTEAFEN